MTVQMDEAVEAAIRDTLNKAGPYDTNELASVETLWVRSAETLIGLKYMSNLESLKLFDCCGSDFDVISQLLSLERLQVTRSALASLESFTSCKSLLMCKLQCNLITDLTPLNSLPNLRFLYVQGNPLTPESYYEILPELEDRGVRVKCSEEGEWRLCRELWERDPRATYGVAPRTHEPHLVVPELSCRSQKPFHAPIEPEELRRELDETGFDVVDVIKRYMPRPFRAEEHRQKADAAGAREWIEASKLDTDEKQHLHGFVDRFNDAVFVREDDELLDEWAGYRGHYWRHWPPTGDGERERLEVVPEWYRRYRSTLAFARTGEESSTCVVFSHFEDERANELVGTKEFNLAAVGASSDDVKRAVVDRHGLLPIGWGGRGNGFALGVSLAASDPKVYVFHASDCFGWDFNPRQLVAFKSVGQMYAAIKALRNETDCDTEACQLEVSPWSGEEPPEIRFDLGSHRTEQTAEQARTRIEASEFDTETKQALGDFVDGFETLGFVREDEQAIEYWEVSNQTRFPKWYRQLRTVLAFPRKDHDKLWVRFASFEDGWPGFPDDVGFEIHVPRVWDVGTRRRLVDEHHVVTIGHAAHYEMVIRVGEQADGRIYFFDTSDFGETSFDPCGSTAFVTVAQMFEQISAIELLGGELVVRDG